MSRRTRGILAPLAVCALLAPLGGWGASEIAGGQESCQIGPRDPSGVYVNLADDLNREAIAHVRAAVARGKPRILHWSPEGADARRDESLRGFPVWSRLPLDARRRIDPVNFDVTHDRDEYPPAASREGGAGADVEYILFADNRSAGSRMRSQMGSYCADTRFVLEP